MDFRRSCVRGLAQLRGQLLKTKRRPIAAYCSARVILPQELSELQVRSARSFYYYFPSHLRPLRFLERTSRAPSRRRIEHMKKLMHKRTFAVYRVELRQRARILPLITTGLMGTRFLRMRILLEPLPTLPPRIARIVSVLTSLRHKQE